MICPKCGDKEYERGAEEPWGHDPEYCIKVLKAALEKEKEENKVLLNMARLAMNAKYSHTQYETDIWYKWLDEEVEELSDEIVEKIKTLERSMREQSPKEEGGQK